MDSRTRYERLQLGVDAFVRVWVGPSCWRVQLLSNVVVDSAAGLSRMPTPFEVSILGSMLSTRSTRPSEPILSYLKV